MHAAHKLILASGSQRRRELLRAAGIQLEVCPANICEDRRPGEPAQQYALRLAQEKAQKIAQQFAEQFVLGADTIVVVDEEVLGKPQDSEDAAHMLRLLSGRAHLVITAVSLIAPGKAPNTRSMTTKVCFRPLDENEIQQYISSGEPRDKAGAYAIQGGAAPWVVSLEGDYSNVVGLPMPLVAEMLHTAGFLQS